MQDGNKPPEDKILPDDRPHTLAMAFLKQKNFGKDASDWLPQSSSAEAARLRHWREDFFIFDGNAYRRLISEEFRADVTTFLNQIFITRKVGRVPLDEQPLRVTRNIVSETIEQMRAISQVRAEAMPVWLDADIEGGQDRPDSRDMIVFQNGWIDAESFVRGDQKEPAKPTPLWFSESVLPCHFHSKSECKLWLNFIESVLDGDAELIEQLQEWFGYCLTSDTGLQKMLWLHGPSGAGKSTLAKVLKHVVGDRNTVSFTLSLLPQRFTLSSFLGKTLAVSADAHLGRDTDSLRVIEYIKGIVGEDDQLVDRKNRDLLPGIRMLTRLVVSVNQFPSLPDDTDTLRRRSLIIPFEKSFAGEANPALADQLCTEAPGIVRWALDGLVRLRMRGKFRPTRRGSEMQDRFSRMSSPISAFIDECCELPTTRIEDKKEYRVLKTDLYRAFVHWWKINGRREPIHKDRFIEAILNKTFGTKPVRAREGDKRINVLEGIRLSGHIANWVDQQPREEEVWST